MATLSAVVPVVNCQRSVGVSLLEVDQWRAVERQHSGNHAVPAVGEVVEVRFLYAVPGGFLCQPVYLDVRNDVESRECVTAAVEV